MSPTRTKNPSSSRKESDTIVSVLHAIADQIAPLRPVTVTHLDVNRAITMIPEACEMAIPAAAAGCAGEAMLLNTGQPVQILGSQLPPPVGTAEVRATGMHRNQGQGAA